MSREQALLCAFTRGSASVTAAATSTSRRRASTARNERAANVGGEGDAYALGSGLGDVDLGERGAAGEQPLANA